MYGQTVYVSRHVTVRVGVRDCNQMPGIVAESTRMAIVIRPRPTAT